MHIILPHSNKTAISLPKFIATWKVWVETFYPSQNFEAISLPRMNAAQNFQRSISQGLESSLDVMCRVLAPPSYLNVMQATNLFMKMNPKWLKNCKAISPVGRMVAGANLTNQCLEFFKGLKTQTRKSLEKDAIQLIQNKILTKYTIETHHHRFAAWAASTAARASKLCRFNVKQGFQILEAVGFGPHFSAPNNLPSPRDLDTTHRKWRGMAILEAESLQINNFTHGVAAKLINCYLKARFVCGPYFSDPKVQALHPPIDRVLLESLQTINFAGQKNKWKLLKSKGWSNFKSEDYEYAIESLKTSLHNSEFWKIEEFWQGHQ